MKQEVFLVSKSSIYNWIAAISPYHKDNIRRHLKYGGRKVRSSASSTRTPIPKRVPIDDRPAYANGQTVADWEMDTIVGKDGKGAIVTLVERESCFMLMEKLNSGKRAVPLAHAVVRLLKRRGLPVRTITTDNGTEFAAHEIIARELGTTVYQSLQI